MKLIASADSNWGIGSAGRLLVSIPSDMKRFRERTTGNIIIAGRKTMETFPGGLPLANRTNLILSEDKSLRVRGAEVVHSIEGLKAKLDTMPEREVYVVGGQSIYRQLLPFCDEAYITKIDHEYAADAYLENLAQSPEWELVEESEEQTYFDLEYTYQMYRRI